MAVGNGSPVIFATTSGLEKSEQVTTPPVSSRKFATALIALFVVVFGARLWLIDVVSSPVPFWDQWDAEGGKIFKPFLLGNLSWSQFFAPHNEHRIVLTRFLTLGLFRLNGMWDPRLEMVANATIAAGTAVVMAYLILLEVGRAWWRYVVGIITVLWVLPYGWENTTWGFQSQFYFLVLFSFVALWGLAYGPPYSKRWWIGLIAMMMACFSMASGFVACIAVAAMRYLAIILDRSAWRTHWQTILAGLVCAGISLLFIHHDPNNDSVRAQGVKFFLDALFRSLSWPVLEYRFAFVLLFVPIIAAAVTLVRQKGNEPSRWLSLALAVWTVMQAALVAYGRGFYGGPPISRYQDFLVIGFLASCLALLLEWRHINRWICYAWLLVALYGLVWTTREDVRHFIPEIRRYYAEQARRCRAYVETHDREVFYHRTDRLDLPYPDLDKLVGFLDDPQLRSIFLFVPGQENKAGWPSRVSNFLLKMSRAIFAIGVLGLLAAFCPSRFGSAPARGEQNARGS